MTNPVQEADNLGQPVSSLQQMLRTHQRARGQAPLLIPTGQFDPETEQAVREFQQRVGLPVTGAADYDTWTALVHAWRLAEEELAHAHPLRVVVQRNARIAPGDSHLHLYPYQAALMALGTVLDVPPLTVTGTQDAQSEAATRWLQERACLPVNGVVDRRTWDAASRLYPAVLGDGSTG